MKKSLTVLGVVALVLGLTGAATASHLHRVFSKNIVNGTIRSVDVRDRTLRVRDLAPSTRGALRLSAFDEVPSGRTIRGVIGYDDNAESAATDYGILTTLPMRATTKLTDADVFVNIEHWTSIDGTQSEPSTTDTHPGCNGSLAAPTAPAGRVCIYVVHSDRADDLNGYGVGSGSNQGVKLNWTANSTGDTFVDAVWAYRAP